jgi:hypothetical protein
MCLKKLLFILLLLSVTTLSLYSQTEANAIGGEGEDLDQGRSAIENERISQVNQLIS